MILITGASGFIGSRLARPGDRRLVRRPKGHAHEVQGDLGDRGALTQACRGVTTVVHCAGLADADSRDGHRLWAVNYHGTCNLLAAALAAGVQRFVLLSSVKAMAEPGEQCVDEDWPGEPATEYGRSKRAAEMAVLEAGLKQGLEVTVLRLPLVYGRGGGSNLLRLARLIERGWLPPLPETGNRRSLVHVDDVVAAVHRVIAEPRANGRVYIVADPVAYSGRQLYAAIREVLAERGEDGPRRPLWPWTLPAAAWRLLGRLGDGLEALTGRDMPVDSRAVARLLDSACYSPARIDRELGFRARMDLRSGLREMLL